MGNGKTTLFQFVIYLYCFECQSKSIVMIFIIYGGGAVYQLCSGVENGATYLFTSFYYQFNFRRSRSCQLNVFPFVNLSFDIIKCEG